MPTARSRDLARIGILDALLLDHASTGPRWKPTSTTGAARKDVRNRITAQSKPFTDDR